MQQEDSTSFLHIIFVLFLFYIPVPAVPGAPVGGAPAAAGGAPKEADGAPVEAEGIPVEAGGPPAEAGGTPAGATGGAGSGMSGIPYKKYNNSCNIIGYIF